MSKYGKLYGPGITEENHKDSDDYIVISLPDSAILEQSERFAADQERLITPMWHSDLTKEEIKQALRFECTRDLFQSNLFRYETIQYCGRCLRMTECKSNWELKEAHCSVCKRRPKQIHFAISPDSRPITFTLDAWKNKQYPMPGDIKTINQIPNTDETELKRAKAIMIALNKFESQTAEEDLLFITWPTVINKAPLRSRIHRKRSNEINHPNHIGQVRWYYYRRGQLEYYDTDTPPHWE